MSKKVKKVICKNSYICGGTGTSHSPILSILGTGECIHSCPHVWTKGRGCEMGVCGTWMDMQDGDRNRVIGKNYIPAVCTGVP